MNRPFRSSALRGRLLRSLVTAMLASVCAACGPVKLVATAEIPTPLIAKLPFAVALYVPPEFSEYVHEEERWSTKWNVHLGSAQSDGLTRLLTAMFERVERVDSLNAGTQLGSEIRAILEPSIEEYAFVTPRDAGSTPFFAVSIRYRVNVYTPEGKLADSWGFTGYGTAPSRGLSSVAPLARATSLAMRDAGAKLAVEFRDQAIVRGLMPAPEPAQESREAPTEAPAGEVPSDIPPGQEQAPAEEAEQAGEAGEVPTDVPTEVPAGDAPPGEGPTEEAPTEEAPAEEAPAEETSTEEVPAEEENTEDSVEEPELPELEAFGSS